MKALTIHQPWAQLAALGIKTIETRSWPAPAALIGQRIAIHAGAKRPGVKVARWAGVDVDPATHALGAVVGSAVLSAWPWPDGKTEHVVVTDQLPFGQFEPGRWAWLLADAAPTTERCPWCDGRGYTIDDHQPPMSVRAVRAWSQCPVCSGAGRCDPVPAKGRPRVWEWTP